MKEFNTTGLCVPERHYMVDISRQLKPIAALIAKGHYFTINRARQYGKTTTLSQIRRQFGDRYLVLSISFEGADDIFVDNASFVKGLIDMIADKLPYDKMEAAAIEAWQRQLAPDVTLRELSRRITNLVQAADKPVVLLIDEVDKSSDNQIFLNFLGLLRAKYLDRSDDMDHTFHSVILAGVHDVRNLKLKLRPEEERKYNSPWNIAAHFDVDMSFHPDEIATMLTAYEADHHTGMDIALLSALIYEYSGGYPFLVSRVCQLIEEKLLRRWTAEGVVAAVQLLLNEDNSLLQSLIGNLENCPELKTLVYSMLIEGTEYAYNRHDPLIALGVMYGILARDNNGVLCLSNRIFELVVYNYMVSIHSRREKAALKHSQHSPFITQGRLDMELLLNKFQDFMRGEYRGRDAAFIEREGRLLFLCFLKPIINGVGFYYVESQTRQDRRMDIVVSLGGEEFIVELKIWHGEQYQAQGREQLLGYLRDRGQTTGWLVSFAFNKDKEYTRAWQEYPGQRIYEVVI